MPSAAQDRTESHTGETLAWSLAMVLRRWQERVEVTLEDIPHGARGFQVLSAVVHDTLPTQGAIAARLAIDRTVLTYLIDDLETAGLVERQLDPRDRRARRIVPTEQGRQVLYQAEDRVAETEQQVLGGLTDSEQAGFRDSARRAAEAILAAAPDTNPCRAVQDVLDQDAEDHQLSVRPA